MATTTNYSWETPDDTDLVKDGAAAIRTLGSSIDTTTKALNPSTTLGDIEYRSSTANTNTRLGIGTTGQVLTVAGGVPSWASPATAAYVGANATKTANQSLTNVTQTLVSFDGADILDTNAFHNPSSNNSRMTIPTGFGGKYLIQAQVQFASNTVGGRELQIYKNGSTVLQYLTEDAEGSLNMSVSGTYALVAGDYVEIRAYQSSGGSLDIWASNSGYTNGTSFQITYLGA